jgi:L-rhamnose mutarotase
VDAQQATTRGLFAMRLYPGTESRFVGLCSNPSRDLIDEAIQAGVRRITGFRRGTDVWFQGEFLGDPQAVVDARDSLPAHRRWWRKARDTVVDAGGPEAISHYSEVFHTNAGPRVEGPMTRGMLSLVIDPDRAADYDAMHAAPWPELMDALAASGFRQYSGYRRGPHVVYYGEFYPDMRTAFGRMAEHEVDARWGAAFEGIITTIRGSDGWLLTARQICHMEA